MPRRVRPPDDPGAAAPEERAKPRLSDELMSQFDAIERTLRARRDAEREQEQQAAQERSATTGGGGVSKKRAAGVRPQAAVPERPAAQAGSSEADRLDPGAAPKWRVRGQRSVIVLVCGAAVVALAVIGTVLALTPTPHGAAASNNAARPAAARPSPTPDEVQAAQWVAVHVGSDRVVACDVDLCAQARQSGVPAASLVTVGSAITDVERADVVISTSLMRGEFGAQLTAICSPEPLASFGSGADQVVVTAVALDGSADYSRRLASDRDARGRVGAVMAHSPRITFLAPEAAAELSDGLVDSRLSSLLTLISSSHTVTVASFTGTGPQAGADIPEPDVVISRIDGRPVGGSAAQSNAQSAALIALVDAQQPPYRPQSVISEADGVKISFSQPEPLGLIAGATP